MGAMKATDDQLTKLAVTFADRGVVDRDDRLLLCSDHAGRRITSSSQLTKVEAHELIERLEGPLRSVDLHAVAYRLKTEAAAPIVCSPKGQQPTEHDRTVIAEFAAQLATARPARTVKRHDSGCDGKGGHLIPAGAGVRYCRCRVVCDVPPAKDRSCPPKVCYCGACPWWTPIPPPQFEGAIAKLTQQDLDRAARRR